MQRKKPTFLPRPAQISPSIAQKFGTVSRGKPRIKASGYQRFKVKTGDDRPLLLSFGYAFNPCWEGSYKAIERRRKMSIAINWDKLNEHVAKDMLDSIQKYIDNAPLPSFITRLELSNFDWGHEVPQVEISDISEPLDIFGRAPVSLEFPSLNESPPRSPMDSPANSIISAAIQSPISVPVSSLPSAPKSKNPFDVQLGLNIDYKGSISMEIHAEFSLNIPSPLFVSLPVKLRVTGMEIRTRGVIAYTSSKLFLCLLRKGMAGNADSDDSALLEEDPVFDFKTEWEVGDTEKPVLKNAVKIERFVVEVLHRYLWDTFVYPNFKTIELAGEDDIYEDVD